MHVSYAELNLMVENFAGKIKSYLIDLIVKEIVQCNDETDTVLFSAISGMSVAKVVKNIF